MKRIMKKQRIKHRVKILPFVYAAVFLLFYLTLYFAVTARDEKTKKDADTPITPHSFGELLRPVSDTVPDAFSDGRSEIPDFSDRSGSFPDTVSLYDASSAKIFSVKLEDYVLGVLLSEMPSSFHPEALKAQSIACRTYTLYRIANMPDSHGNGAELCTSASHCQCYTDPSLADTERYVAAKRAVDETKGIIMTFEKEPILAVYHASSYKMTRSSEEVFGGRLPYLIPVESPECFDPSLGTQKEYVFSKETVASCIKDVCPKLCDKSDGEVLSALMAFCGKYPDGEEMILLGETVSLSDISDFLHLRSSDISFSEREDGVGITAYGYGHGVGMSQCGAQKLALSGYGCYDILSHYYSGVSFSRI